MRKFIATAFIILLIRGFGCGPAPVPALSPDNLRCEYLTDPLGIDSLSPRLAWELTASGRGRKQTAYRVLVSSSSEFLADDRGDLWDSGRVESDRTCQIVYSGAPLESGARCYWKVRVWDRDGRPSPFSPPAFWTMGRLAETDWNGEWIAAGRPAGDEGRPDYAPGPPPPWFRRSFPVDRPIARAYVYASARGLFELHLNGNRVGEDYFAPEWTDYSTRIHYRTYDVTPLIRSGDNVIGAVLGDGWWSGYVAWRPRRGHYDLENSLLINLVIEYPDGPPRVIATGGDWKWSEGPIRSADLLMGETYDARRDMPGWSESGFDDSGWNPVRTVAAPAARLSAQPSRRSGFIRGCGPGK